MKWGGGNPLWVYFHTGYRILDIDLYISIYIYDEDYFFFIIIIMNIAYCYWVAYCYLDCRPMLFLHHMGSEDVGKKSGGRSHVPHRKWFGTTSLWVSPCLDAARRIGVKFLIALVAETHRFTVADISKPRTACFPELYMNSATKRGHFSQNYLSSLLFCLL